MRSLLSYDSVVTAIVADMKPGVAYSRARIVKSAVAKRFGTKKTLDKKGLGTARKQVHDILEHMVEGEYIEGVSKRGKYNYSAFKRV